MLPDLDGFEVHRRLTAEGRTAPVLFLTARDATEDKVRGLSLGADDYVTKPFSLEELVARVRAILRRTAPVREERATSVLRFADLEIDEDAHEVQRAGERIDLTATEYNLLRYLMLNPRRVLSKGQILDHVWHYDFRGDANVVETYISYLRRKVDAVEPNLIHTVRGAGYVLREPR
jgi:two-component system OmpR family response regulator